MAFTGPELERAADAYGAALARRETTARQSAADAIAARDAAEQEGRKPEAVKAAEAVVGQALAGRAAGGELLAQSWLRLAKAWREHLPRSAEVLWATYNATRAVPPLAGAERTQALDVAATTLLDQVKALRADFDYRTQTIGRIGTRLADRAYDDQRIELERRRSELPADVRELIDLRGREEKERALVVERLMAAIQGIDRVYRELSQAGGGEAPEDEIKAALDTRVLTVKKIYADAHADRARLCIRLSLPLQDDAGEFATVYRLPRTSADQAALTTPLVRDRTVKGDTICVLGLAHGETYHVALRKGLAAKVGARLAADYDTRTRSSSSDGDEQDGYAKGITVPDRPETAGFRSNAFILPRQGGGAIPLMTVNLDRVDIDVLRLSDRALYRRIALGQIGTFLDYREFADISRHFSDPYWSGLAKVANRRNETVTTELPIRALIDKRSELIGRLAGAQGGAGQTGLPYLGESQTLGSLEGRYRVDKLSTGTPDWTGEQPGLYAVVAKVPHVGWDHFLGRPPGAEEYESDDDSSYAAQRRKDIKSKRTFGNDQGTSTSDWSRGQGSCPDGATGRTVACLVSVQWLVVSDIGLSYFVGPNELYVVARSLGTGKPLPNARVELVAASNRVLGEATTDSRGVASFRAALARGKDGNRLAAITAADGADFSFIDYKRDSFDLSEHGVAGRTPPRSYDVYIYTDRGIYRPEETINATVLVRDTTGSAPGRIPPITLRLRPSSGVVAAETRLAPDSWRTGGAGLEIPIPPTAALGTADLVATLGETDQVIGTATIQIDHFRPDRARITLGEAKSWQVAAAEGGQVTLKGEGRANYLYGMSGEGNLSDAPGANLAGELAVLFRRAPSPVPGCYEGFNFERAEADFTPRLHRVTLPRRTDETGRIAIETTATLPAGDHPLEAEVALTVLDEAGKVGVQSLVLPMPVARPWLGVRHEARLVAGREGHFAMAFDLVAIGPGHAARAARVGYRIYRERNAFVWHQLSNSWKYQQSVERQLVADGSIRTTAQAGGAVGAGGCIAPNGRISQELPLGRYLLELEDEGGRKLTYRLDSGWSSADVRAPTPDRLTIHADASRGADDLMATYKPGATATFSIEAPFDGEVMLAIANERVHLWDASESTRDRRATVKVRIPASWAGQSFYALATVYRRNTDGSTERGPARAVGAFYFNVDLEASRHVRLEILPGGQEVQDPSHKVQLSPSRPVSLKLRGNIEGKAWATVYAIDEGLLTLTRHRPPEPYRAIFGQRALAMSLLDNYGRILLSERAWREKSGGDRSRRLLLSNYTSDRVLARFMGPVEFVDGVADVTFPEAFDFNGEIRLMAIAWNEDKVGGAARSIVMRQQIVSELRMPRAMAAGDRVHATVNLHNVEAWPGRYRVTLEPKGAVSIGGLELVQPGQPSVKATGNSLELELPHLGSRTIRATLAARSEAATGLSGVALKVENVGPEAAAIEPIVRAFDVAVRPSLLPETQVALLRLAPGERLRLDDETVRRLTGGRFIEGRLSVSAHAGSDLARLVRENAPGRGGEAPVAVSALERLVWQGLKELNGPASGDRQKALAAIVRGVEALQTTNDFFSLYRLENETGLGESEDIGDRTGTGLVRIEQSEIWRTALALDFLLEARRAGVTVGGRAVTRSIRALKAEVRDALRRGANRDRWYDDSDRERELTPTPAEAALRMLPDKDDPAAALARPAVSAPPPPEASARQAGDEAGDGEGADLAGRGGDERDKEASDDDAADTYEHDDAIKDAGGPEEVACREDYLYASFVLATADGLDRSDLVEMQRMCSAARFRPVGSAILAAALWRFGLDREARVVTASIDARFGASGRAAGGDPDGRFDPVMLAFLAIADAPEPVRREVADRIVEHHGEARSLSLATQAWLMRAAAARQAQGPAGRPARLALDVTGLEVERRSDEELVTKAASVQRLEADAGLVNGGQSPVYVALLFRGVPEQQAPDAGTEAPFKVERRILNADGKDVSGGLVPIRPGEMLYVLVTGERQGSPSGDKSELSAPVLVMDGTASTFEIVDKDVFDLARRAGSPVRALLPTEGRLGRLRMVEARDDGLLAVVRPASDGRFSLGYTVRVVAPGAFVLPGTLVEDLRRTEVALQTPRSRITVAGDRP